VLSGSMEPTFSPGDVIFVERVDAASLGVGDTITFHAQPGSKTLVTHRIIEVLVTLDGPRFRTQGDANDSPDPTSVAVAQIVGKYDFHIPYWGLLSTLLKTRLGYALLILVPGITIIGIEFVKLYRELDARDRAKRVKVEFEVVEDGRRVA
jgi:signal peptidase I